MKTYTFEMDESESFARVLCNGKLVATISNCKVSGGLSALIVRECPLDHLHNAVWEEFYSWCETMIGKGIVEINNDKI